MNYPLLNEQMPQTIIRVWRLRTITSLIIFSLLFAASFGFYPCKTGFTSGCSPLVSLLALTLISHLLSFVLMSYRYKFHRYEIQEKRYRYSTWLSISQHHVYSDPPNPAHRNGPRDLLRKYALVSLQIHTAATNHTIEGLPVAQAERLRETIMNLVEVVKDDL